MAFRYPTPFREAACARMLAGERVEDLAAELGVAAGTLYRWKAQALIDAGLKPGQRSYEPDEYELAAWTSTGRHAPGPSWPQLSTARP